MVAFEVYYSGGYYKQWDSRCVDHHEINATVSNGGPGHNHQSADDNYNELVEMSIARYNLVMMTDLKPEDFTFTPSETNWQKANESDITVVDGSEWS